MKDLGIQIRTLTEDERVNWPTLDQKELTEGLRLTIKTAKQLKRELRAVTKQSKAIIKQLRPGQKRN